MNGHGLLTPATLAHVSRLSVRTRTPPTAAQRGRRGSRRVGNGTDMIDTRRYSPGDDVRRIDWGAYARFERLMVRVVADERPLRLGLIVDRSTSMAFGDPSKLRMACRLAACLAAAAVASEDRVTLVDSTEEARVHVRAASGTRGLAHLLTSLAALTADGATDLPRTASRMRAAMGGRGLCVVVSDLLDPAGPLTAAEQLRRHGHEVALVRVLTPFERDPVGLDGAALEDAETGEWIALPPSGVREAYREVFEEETETLRRGAASLGASFLDVESDEGVDAMLERALTVGLLHPRSVA